MEKLKLKSKIISNGVNNLKDFGYENVNESNIMTDEVYKVFFINMLNENLGVNPVVDKVIEELLEDIK